MSDTKSLIAGIRTNLITVFNVKYWNNPQYDLYKLLRQYVNSFREESRIFELKDDKVIIRNNFKEQSWFNNSKSKPIIGHLIDIMKIKNYSFTQNEQCINYNIVIDFDQFVVNGCLYQNVLNRACIFYICFENNKHHKAYLTYYTHILGFVQTDELKKIRLPEFDQIYNIINISQTILYQCDLVNFFSEIIMYYDESQSIGNLPKIGRAHV